MGSTSVHPPYNQSWSALQWLTLAMVFMVAAALTFASKSQSANAKFSISALNLHAEDQGDHILVRWNHDVVRSANKGVLRISDGAQHREIQLDSDLIAHGSILYRPVSNDVNLELEIPDPQGRVVSERMRLVDGFASTDTSLTAGSVLKTTVVAVDNPRPHNRATQVDPFLAEVRSKQQTALQTDDHADAREVPLDRLPPANPAGLPAAQTTDTVLTQSSSEQAAVPLVFHPATLPPAKLDEPVNPAQAIAQPEISNSIDTLSNKPVLAPSTPVPSENLPPARKDIESTPALNFVPAEAIRKVVPDLPGISIATPMQIQVNVKVDATGRVTEAQLVSDRGNRTPRLTFAALGAAKQWIFKPATLRGQNVASDHLIVFRFGPTAH